MGTNAFLESDIRSFKAPMKVGILGTVNEAGLPHLTLISTLQAASPVQLVFGQFTEGLSKDYIRRNPQAGFLVLSLQKELWRGKAVWTHIARAGQEFEQFNNIPMFRYNAYFGIHTVYYLDLVEQTGKEALAMGAILPAALKTLAAGALSRRPSQSPVLNEWTRGLLNKVSNLRFLASVGADGFPWIIPLFQVQAPDSRRLIFSPSAYRQDLEALPAGVPVAVFGMTLQMEDVLVRGVYQGQERVRGIHCGVVEVDWVYNPMPPKPQQIYPPVGLEAVTNY
jgi:hypothetical protein